MNKCDNCINTYTCSDKMKNKGECVLYKPITNGDKIRSMTDEELAKFFEGLMDDESWHEYKENLEWLQSEVEE